MYMPLIALVLMAFFPRYSYLSDGSEEFRPHLRLRSCLWASRDHSAARIHGSFFYRTHVETMLETSIKPLDNLR
jgi:hypothetical protein